MTRRLVLILLLSASVTVVAACGESKADKAKKQVCSATSSIQSQVNKLKGMTLSSATTTDVKNSLNTIQSDLTKIKDATPDLSAQFKKDVQSANQTFTSQLQSIVSELGTNLSISNAQSKLQAALQQLASAYQSSLAKLSCS